MKIAFVLNYFEPTGGDRIIWHHIDLLRRKMNKVDIYSRGEFHPAFSYFWTGEEFYFYEPNKIQEIDFGSYDFVVGCGLWGAFNALKINTNNNKIFFCQNYDPWIFSHRIKETAQLIQTVYNEYKHFLVYSKDLGQIIEKNYGEKLIHYCTNGVDYSQMRKFQNNKIKKEKRICLMSMYDGPLKGTDLAEEVFEILKKKEYVLVSINGIGERVKHFSEYYQAPNFDYKCKIIASCSVFLNTSVFETWCLAIHEAMALGTPVVCTDSKGINEYLTNDLDAIIVKERNADLIVSKIEQLCADKKKYSKIQENGMKNAELHDWYTIKPKILETYSKINQTFILDKKEIYPVYFTCKKHFNELENSIRSLFTVCGESISKVLLYVDKKDMLTTDQKKKLLTYGPIIFREAINPLSWGGTNTVESELAAFEEISMEIKPDDLIMNVDSDTVFISRKIFEDASLINSDLIGQPVKSFFIAHWDKNLRSKDILFHQGACYFLRSRAVPSIIKSYRENKENLIKSVCETCFVTEKELPCDITINRACVLANVSIHYTDFFVPNNKSVIHFELTKNNTWLPFANLLGLKEIGEHKINPLTENLGFKEALSIKSPTLRLDDNGKAYVNNSIKLSEEPIKFSNISVINQLAIEKQRFLFVAPMSRFGKPLLKKIIKKLGYADFDYLFFVYDDERFDEKEFRGCKFIYEKKLKWEYAKKYLTPDYCSKYAYVFFWDDDVDILNFNYKKFIKILNVNNLEMAQPALSLDSYYTWKITLQDKAYPVGRFTNFVEIGPATVFSKAAWKKFWKMIDPKLNKWGWGYDLLARKICGYERQGIIDCEPVKHTRPIESGKTKAPEEMLKLLKRYGEKEFNLFNYGALVSEEKVKSIQKSIANDNLKIKQMEKKIKKFSYSPKISIIVPVFNTPPAILERTIKSILGQVYPNWELCIANGGSDIGTRDVLNKFGKNDSRIKILSLKTNLGIAENSNKAISLASGEYIALVDHDDIITNDCLYEVVNLLQKHPEADMIYSDEGRINEAGEITSRYFKPDWSPDLLLSNNYINHIEIYRLKIINEIGGFRMGFEGSQDYDLILRFTEKTNKIFHIPKILYYWTIWENSMSGTNLQNCLACGKKAIEEAMIRRKIKIEKILINGNNHYLVRYKILGEPLVSIIISTKDKVDLLKKCVSSILSKTLYPNYEIVIINNKSIEKETFYYFDQIKNIKNIKIINYNKKFNFSAINNYAVPLTKGDYILFLNNDTEVISNEWLGAMLELCQRNEVGAVGAKLIYPNDTIQHAGVVLGLGGVAGHSHRMCDSRSGGYAGKLFNIQNVSAVTAACLMTKRNIFEGVGGFDEKNLAIAFNDIDFCLKIRQKEYLILYTPNAELYHYESASRGIDTPKLKRFVNEINFMKNKWGKLLQNDPYYNPNLTLDREDYTPR